MRLEDLNWMDVERYLEQDDRIILVTGATEQHAHLSLLTDILIPMRMALGAAEREHVLIAPPLNFGFSRSLAAFPGTISLTPRTFDLVLLEIIECLLHQGFRRFLVLNGHGGNHMPARLVDFQEKEKIRVRWFDWWSSPAVKDFQKRYGLEIGHANWGENFPFCRVAEVPTGVKPAPQLRNPEDIFAMRQDLGDGCFGGPYQVDEALMHELFALAVEETCAALRAL
ncbi:MAG: creatininase family protein [Anaerolineae bacterium]|nr:creatininase family protein [Anaerolineae bacterium]